MREIYLIFSCSGKFSIKLRNGYIPFDVKNHDSSLNAIFQQYTLLMLSSLVDVKKLFSLIISFSLLYLVLCSIPHFHVISYMLLVIYLINQFHNLLTPSLLVIKEKVNLGYRSWVGQGGSTRRIPFDEMLLVWKERFGKAFWQDVKEILFF